MHRSSPVYVSATASSRLLCGEGSVVLGLGRLLVVPGRFRGQDRHETLADGGSSPSTLGLGGTVRTESCSTVQWRPSHKACHVGSKPLPRPPGGRKVKVEGLISAWGGPI